MATYYNTDGSHVIPVVHHKVGERVIVLFNGAQAEAPRLIIRDTATGNYFNKNLKEFESYSSVADSAGYYTFTMNELYDLGIYNLSISTLPNERQRLLFEYQTVTFEDEGGSTDNDAIDEITAQVIGTPFIAPNSGNYQFDFDLTGGATDVVYAELLLNGTDIAYTSVSVNPTDVSPQVNVNGGTESYSFTLNGVFASDEVSVKAWAVPFDGGDNSYDVAEISNIKVYGKSYERHVFGGDLRTADTPTCTVYGTLLDVSGRPLVGEKVEVYLNRAGYFTHKAGLVGYAATTLTDDSGYWEIPIIVGLDVTINVPIIGFSQSGFVPALSSVELTPETLLKYKS